MNRRTFNKYLLAAPIGLVALLTRPLTASVSPAKEKDEELSLKEMLLKRRQKGEKELRLAGDRITAWGRYWAEPLPRTGVSNQQLKELARATTKDMPKMKGWEVPRLDKAEWWKYPGVLVPKF